MGRYRIVECSLYEEEWFQELAPDAKLVFLFVFQNSHTSACGALKMSPLMIGSYLGIDRNRIETVLKGFGNRIEWFQEVGVVWVRGFYQHQSCNVNFGKAAVKSAASLPEIVLTEFKKEYPELYRYPSDTPPIPLRNGIDTTRGHTVSSEQESVSSEQESGAGAVSREREERAGAPPARFIPPTPADVLLYARSIEGDPEFAPAYASTTSTEMAADFRDYYAGNGWMTGGRSMADWQASFRRWVRREGHDAGRSRQLTVYGKGGSRSGNATEAALAAAYHGETK